MEQNKSYIHIHAYVCRKWRYFPDILLSDNRSCWKDRSVLNSCLCMLWEKFMIFPHSDIPMFQHHLLKRVSFPHWITLVLLSKVSWPYTRRYIFGHYGLWFWLFISNFKYKIISNLNIKVIKFRKIWW